MNLVKSYFSKVNGANIFYTLIGDFNASEEAVIYFSPFFEERIWVQRIAFNYACELWDKFRIPVILFDYPGYGESDGEPEDFTIANSVDATSQIKRDIKGTFGIKKFHYWSVRTGAHIALKAIDPDDMPETLVMWMPVYDMQKYIDKELRTVISFQFSVYKKILVDRKVIMEEVSKNGKCVRDIYQMNNIEGYRFGKAFINEVFSNNDEANFDHLLMPTFILEGIKNKKRLSAKKDNFFENLQKNKNICINDVETHTFWQYTQNYSQKITPVFKKTHDWYREKKND